MSVATDSDRMHRPSTGGRRAFGGDRFRPQHPAALHRAGTGHLTIGGRCQAQHVAIHVGVGRPMVRCFHVDALGIWRTLPAVAESTIRWPDRHSCQSIDGQIKPDWLTRARSSLSVFAPRSPRHLQNSCAASLTNAATPRGAVERCLGLSGPFSVRWSPRCLCRLWRRMFEVGVK